MNWPHKGGLIPAPVVRKGVLFRRNNFSVHEVAPNFTPKNLIQSFPQCTACSDTVLEHYRDQSYDFLAKVFTPDGADYLEELTGLAAMKNIDECDVIELSDDDF